MNKEQIIEEVFAELDRAKDKFPKWPTDPVHALAVVAEELGECQKEVLQMTYEAGKSTKANVRSEAIQTAAMAIRFLMSLDEYEYSPSKDHADGWIDHVPGDPMPCDGDLLVKVCFGTNECQFPNEARKWDWGKLSRFSDIKKWRPAQ